MKWDTIQKELKECYPVPNLMDYHKVSTQFSWDNIQNELDGLPESQGLNIAYEAVDRHVSGGKKDHPAIRWLGPGGRKLDISYDFLKGQTSRFANVLKMLGVRKSNRVFVLSEKIPELYISALGAMKYGAVFCPLFPAFGSVPIIQRIQKGAGRVLVTSKRLYENRIKPHRHDMPYLKHVLITDCENDSENGVWSFHKIMREASNHFSIPPTAPEDMALLHFTSGTTGMPKAAVHVHKAVLMHYMTGKYVLDFHPEDIFWCTADPGWVTGTSYGIISPLTHGLTNIVDQEDFDANRWLSVLEKEGVTIWYTSPTAIRRLMRLETKVFQNYDLSRLRLIFSVGEPLNPKAVVWGQKTFGCPIHDTWWQTETGGIMIANFAGMDIKPGSMGKPIPGIEAAILQRKENGHTRIIHEPGSYGELAIKSGWPSMFREYLNEPERYRKCFIDQWYLSGDLAFKDKDGYFWFVGRNDDIIKTAGHMVGPFEVENSLMAHPAVAEAAVVGKPDPIIGNIVKAFVSLKDGFCASDNLRLELIGFTRKHLGPALAPREIEFMQNLPKNKAGKIMRRLLKNTAETS
jgi:acetyl-CoA synthetase